MKKENGMTIVTMIAVFVILLVLAGIIINLLFGENGMFNDIKNYVCNVLNIKEQNTQEQIENHYINENINNNTDTNILNSTKTENTNTQSSSWYN